MPGSEYLEIKIAARECGSGNFYRQPNFDSVENIIEGCLFPSDETSQGHIVEVAKKYMHVNFCSKISVQEIAKKVFVSRYHFSRIFKKHTQYSPYQYLMDIRLQQAKKLLQQKELTIKEISSQSGFSNVDYFSAAFTRKYDVCPSLYRKKIL